ncbi:hypothetical protein AAFF_G00041140 [Aldrovandia affinis]|uniref:Uncharacterized protein n=1 Tax=Aldrovandia affinis TaxID=143900 RepID=A0AAD7S2I7_9TELE|nr:hypothetical protein AAFF_G00041140 [Aldrovandia affinis]
MFEPELYKLMMGNISVGSTTMWAGDLSTVEGVPAALLEILSCQNCNKCSGALYCYGVVEGRNASPG